ncbi:MULTISPECIES: preprotein translocase subunit SecA [Treponema]|uniref:Protein translocase subunit SecA n=2 Tax=Treponema denticola TaxID=158 RepID=SECA_TREDE|nr:MULTISPECIES: preprotein translocase subunit SecA [Treponema]Q73LG6.1 RecName: Full=Protein translocase subunit SecA [Treponema denticola ATCC 35405]AAS12412.1 preprotein translocase, SecA subunit [Treponema denticola ATCC 35405]EMB38299.1 protein translocase subunit secA [Treponema denticola ATCC 33521]EMB39247.1 protein translocase subunit secA [Treponema denticola ATCC 35404]HCY95908.1 preprotein translocase subunit SecA [Treponema sp.]
MLDSIIKILFGSKHERDIKAMLPILHKINEKEAWALSLSEEEFKAKTDEFRERYQKGESLDSFIPEAFALAREAARRILGERPYDVQILGSLVLHSGKIVEMKTGEGKTLMSVAAAYLNSLTGKGVHIVTVNDYLAERDADWMRPVYSYLGVSVGVILSNMENDARRIEYNCDITYGTNNEFGFDYLRDNMQMRLKDKTQREFSFAIVDEIDSILIDEARTPLIISGAAEDDTQRFFEVDRLIGQLKEVEKNPETGEYPNELEGEEVIGDYTIDEKSKRVSFTDSGMLHIQDILQRQGLIKSGNLFDEENFEYIHYFTQSVRAHVLFHIDVDYVIQDGQVQIVDEFTGRVLEGRRYSDGLHQAIEAKEHIKIAQRNRTLATITFQNFFRMYDKLSGMTGTADTEAVEFTKIYNLDVVVIPTNLPVARKDEHDVIYLNENDKFEALCTEISEAYKRGQPVLVGTVSIEKSELISKLLTKRGVRHEVLNAKNHEREALIIAEAGAKGSVTIATNMAGRGTDIKLGGSPEMRAKKRTGTNPNPDYYEKVLAEEYAKWQSDYNEVKELGGLYVIGTERHESRRIDNQLRGRSGRQGDPGRSKFFLSLDDDLMRLFGGENLKNVMSKIGMRAGEPIEHPWINKSIEKAQTKVENRNFDIRKHLLEYDDVLNEQRSFIYEQRNAILEDENLIERIYATLEEFISEKFDEYSSSSKAEKEERARLIKDIFREKFSYTLTEEDFANIDKKNHEEEINEFVEHFTKELKEKEALAGKENLNMFIRYQYLQAIDKKWLDHLENLESLREAVYLRSYGQKNPLTEYKLEGFDIFYSMLDDIRIEIASRLVRVQISTEEEAHASRQMRSIQGNAQHNSMGSFSGSGHGMGPTALSARSRPENAQVVRTVPKVGRNDPCPCGSGKKYKYCCGKNG